ncbi:MAG: glycosyltransferase [Candidatus Dojkabacteria bacterium]
MRKIIVLLFNDFTNDNRVLKECRSLSNNDYKVELVATRFDKNLPKNEEVEGFQVKRYSVGGIKFLPLNLLFFWLQAIKNYRKESIFHCNDLYALPPAFWIKKFFNKNTKIVYDCHEHETEAQIYIGNRLIQKIAQIFERKMIYTADKVITVSESIAKDYVQMYKIEKPQLVFNSPLFESIKKYDLFREELGIQKDKEIFLFQGKYLPGRGLNNLIEIFKDLEKVNRNIVLVFLIYGEGAEAVKEQIRGYGNIYWHDKVSVMEYMKYVASADWGIYLMENICKNHDYALPNKIFDYVLGGLPVVVSNLKEMSNFVNENKVGYAINPHDKEGAIELLKKIDQNSKNIFLPNLKKVAKKYSWEEQEKVLLNIYNSF